MELKVLESAVTELAEDQKATGNQLETLTTQAKELGEKVDSFGDKLSNLQVFAPAVDTAPISRQLAEHFQKIAEILEMQPKNVIKQYRFLLFPTDNTDYYYRIIFGRLFGWGVLILLCTYLFSLGQQYIETTTAASNRRYYYETYQDAWIRLDSLLDAPGRKKMEKAMLKAEKNQ
jgi:hypothetical protein